VEVLPIRALVDVKVKEVSQVRSQALQVLSTENAQLEIKRIRVSDVRGWSAVMQAVASEATRQLLRQAPGQYLAGLRGLPHYLSHLSAAVSGLVLVPWQEYSRSGNVSQGLVTAWTNFARELTVGSADLAGRAMVDTSALLDRLLGDDVSGTSPGDKRPSKYAGLPSNTTEGLQGAWESMTRELKTAKDRLFVVPMREYRQRGPQGLLRSVVKGVPVAIVKPLVGTAEGLGKVFLGVRNSIDKNQKLDSDNKYGK
jgi:autophagy-related protein 2